MLALVEVAWGFGMAACSFQTVVAFLLSRLGASDRLIGILSATGALTIALPQLYAAYRTEHLPRKLTFLTLMHYPACAAVAGVGWAASRADAMPASTTIWLVILCSAVFGLSLGAVVPTWVHLVGKVLPEEGRNTTWGRIMAAGPVAGLLGAWLSRHILGGDPTFGGYAACALVAAFALTVGSSLFWLVREPEEPEVVSHETFRHFLGTYVGGVVRSAPFRRLLLTRGITTAFGGAATAFLSVAAKHRFGLADEQAATFTAAAVASQVLHSLWGAPLGDRWGNRALLALSPLILAAGCALAAFAPSPAWFTAAFLLVGGLWMLDLISFNGLVLAYSDGHDKTAFIAAAGVLLAPLATVAPLAAGVLIEATSYTVIFVIGGVGCLLGSLATLLWVVEPREQAVTG